LLISYARLLRPGIASSSGQGGGMADPGQTMEDRYFEVIDLLHDLVWTYNGMTRIVRNGARIMA
jgi:hypothetical protein